MKLLENLFKKTKKKAEDAIDDVTDNINDVTDNINNTLKDGKNVMQNADKILANIGDNLDGLTKLAAIGLGIQIVNNLINLCVNLKNIDIIHDIINK